MTELIQEKISKDFKHGDFVFTYYRFVDKFHIEPRDWKDLLELSDYVSVENSIHKLIVESTKQE